MKLVVISDLHADRDTLGVPRTEEIGRAVEDSVTYALDFAADAFLFLGDLSDPDSGGATFNAIDIALRAALTLARNKVRSIWIRGNHDVWEDGTGACCLSPLAALDNEWVHVAQGPQTIDLDDQYRLLCLPYSPVSHAYDPRAVATKAFAELPRTMEMIVGAHLMIPGVVIGEETTEMPRGRDILFPVEETARATLRLNGHYHHRQTTREGIIIPGSFARFTFNDEKHEPGFLSIEL